MEKSGHFFEKLASFRKTPEKGYLGYQRKRFREKRLTQIDLESQL